MYAESVAITTHCRGLVCYNICHVKTHGPEDTLRRSGFQDDSQRGAVLRPLWLHLFSATVIAHL